MRPLIVDGDRIWITIPKKPYQCGNLVLALTDTDELVCHRIINVTDSAYWLCGDASNAYQTHRPESLFAVVAYVERSDQTLHFEGHIARFFDYFLGFLHTLSITKRESYFWLFIEATRRFCLQIRCLAWQKD